MDLASFLAFWLDWKWKRVGNVMRWWWRHVLSGDATCGSSTTNSGAEAAEYYLKPCQDEVQPVVQNVKKLLGACVLEIFSAILR